MISGLEKTAISRTLFEESIYALSNSKNQPSETTKLVFLLRTLLTSIGKVEAKMGLETLPLSQDIKNKAIIPSFKSLLEFYGSSYSPEIGTSTNELLALCISIEGMINEKLNELLNNWKKPNGYESFTQPQKDELYNLSSRQTIFEKITSKYQKLFSDVKKCLINYLSYDETFAINLTSDLNLLLALKVTSFLGPYDPNTLNPGDRNNSVDWEEKYTSLKNSVISELDSMTNTRIFVPPLHSELNAIITSNDLLYRTNQTKELPILINLSKSSGKFYVENIYYEKTKRKDIASREPVVVELSTVNGLKRGYIFSQNGLNFKIDSYNQSTREIVFLGDESQLNQISTSKPGTLITKKFGVSFESKFSEETIDSSSGISISESGTPIVVEKNNSIQIKIKFKEKEEIKEKTFSYTFEENKNYLDPKVFCSDILKKSTNNESSLGHGVGVYYNLGASSKDITTTAALSTAIAASIQIPNFINKRFKKNDTFEVVYNVGETSKTYIHKFLEDKTFSNARSFFDYISSKSFSYGETNVPYSNLEFSFSYKIEPKPIPKGKGYITQEGGVSLKTENFSGSLEQNQTFSIKVEKSNVILKEWIFIAPKNLLFRNAKDFVDYVNSQPSASTGLGVYFNMFVGLLPVKDADGKIQGFESDNILNFSSKQTGEDLKITISDPHSFLKFGGEYSGSSPQQTFFVLPTLYCESKTIGETISLKTTGVLGSFSAFGTGATSPPKKTIGRYLTFSTEPFLSGSDVEVSFTVQGSQGLRDLFVLESNVGFNKVSVYTGGNDYSFERIEVETWKQIKSAVDRAILLKGMQLQEEEQEDEEFSLDASPSRTLIRQYFDINDLDVNFDFDQFDSISTFLKKQRPFQNLKDFPTSPRWQSKGFKDIFKTKQIEKFQSTLSSVESKLKKAEAMLKAIEALVNLASRLSTEGTDLISSAMDTIANAIDGIVNNFASTGVYVLDMYSYSRTPHAPLLNTLEIDGGPKEANQSLSRRNYTYDYASGSLLTNDDINNTLAPKEGDETWNLGNYDSWAPFRPITYSEFISVVAEAFIDPLDRPDGVLLGEAAISSRGATYEKGAKADDWFLRPKKGVARPGAPQWGPGSKSVVYVVAFVCPSFQELSNIMNLLQKFQNRSRKAFVGSGKEKSSFMKTFEDIQKTWTEGIDNDYKEIYSQVQKDKISSEAFGIVSGGTYPDFYGYSLESLLPGIFNQLRSLTNMARAGSQSVSNSLNETFQDVITEIRGYIGYISDAVALIRDLVSLISSLQQFNASVLKVTSTGGVYDIYDQLMSASGFPDEETDPPRWIFGWVLAAGVPDIQGTKDTLFNYGSLIKDSSKEFNAFAKDSLKEYNKSVAENKNSQNDGGMSGLEKFGNILG